MLDDGVEQATASEENSNSNLTHNMVWCNATRKKTVSSKVVEDMELGIFESL